MNSRADAERAIEMFTILHLEKECGAARAQKYGLGFEEYKLWLAKESIIVVQIEHIKAIEIWVKSSVYLNRCLHYWAL